MKKVILALVVFLSISLNAIAGVNINTATQAELESLDGIGPIKAQSIIDHRKKNGGFKSVDDLKQVDGIGSATLENLRKNISITGPTTAVPPKANKTVKAIKPAKDIKAVGNEKAAASGKTAEAKVAKEKSGK
jgi:competence protein ComEA